MCKVITLFIINIINLYRIRKIKSTFVYQESKIESVFNLYLLKSNLSSQTKKELELKSVKKVLRELSIILCYDLEPAFNYINSNYKQIGKISYPFFKECLLNYLNKKEDKIINILYQQENFLALGDIPTNDDLVNNNEMILNNINLTNNINLILLHRSLFILQKKFKQYNIPLKELYIKYGTNFEGEENLLIDDYKIPKLLNEIFNLAKFEISDADSFEEILYKEMEYYNEIITDEIIFENFVDFIKTNRKKYNYIFREKRNNVNFELNDYQNLEMNGEDDLTRLVEMKIEDEDEQNPIKLRKNKTTYVLFKRYNLMELYDDDKISICKKSVNMDKNSAGKYSLSKDDDWGDSGEYSESGEEEEFSEISDIHEIDSNENEEEIENNRDENNDKNNKNENNNENKNNGIKNNENKNKGIKNNGNNNNGNKSNKNNKNGKKNSENINREINKNKKNSNENNNTNKNKNNSDENSNKDSNEDSNEDSNNENNNNEDNNENNKNNNDDDNNNKDNSDEISNENSKNNNNVDNNKNENNSDEDSNEDNKINKNKNNNENNNENNKENNKNENDNIKNSNNENSNEDNENEDSNNKNDSDENNNSESNNNEDSRKEKSSNENNNEKNENNKIENHNEENSNENNKKENNNTNENPKNNNQEKELNINGNLKNKPLNKNLKKESSNLSSVNFDKLKQKRQNIHSRHSLHSNHTNKEKHLLFTTKKKRHLSKDKKKIFYATSIKINKKKFKTIKTLRRFIYIEILPLIIGDFISDENSYYVILDHGDDLRNSLSSIFDVELLNRMGNDVIENVTLKRKEKINWLFEEKKKVEKNIDCYEKLKIKMSEQNQNINYVDITINKLNKYCAWINNKIHVIQNDLSIMEKYESNIKIKKMPSKVD